MLLSRDEARRRLLSWLGLCHPLGQGIAGARTVLGRLRCIQLDPLDAIGTNADLVARARVDELSRGEVYPALLPGHAFEHFAKERCLVPAARFPAYRARALQAPWWRLNERLQRVDEGLIAAVLDEVRARGPLTVEEMEHRGRVEALDWSGWKGTGNATRMAMEVLWTRCEVVVCGRLGRRKLYDISERALGRQEELEPDEATAQLLADRIAACGLMSLKLGPWWSGLREQRGRAGTVRVEGIKGEFLCSEEFLDHSIDEPDERLRVLGPLEPLIWDRDLVRAIFGFDYAWEVYTPAAKRRYGWYVVPLLHHGRLVGRMEGRTVEGKVEVVNLWEEEAGAVDRRALEEALG